MYHNLNLFDFFEMTMSIPEYSSMQQKQKYKTGNNYDAIVNKEGSIQMDMKNYSLGSARLNVERTLPSTISGLSRKKIITTIPHTAEYQRIINQNKFEEVSLIYSKVCTDTNGTLPESKLLLNQLEGIYSNALMNNLINIYQYSASYYKQITTKPNDLIKTDQHLLSYQEQITSKQKNIIFIKYQKFIFLLTLIKYVEDNKYKQEFQELDDQTIIKQIINWCENKYFQDLDYILNGPESNTNYKIDFISKYNGIISPANTIQDINDYMQLTTQQNISAGINNIKDTLNQRKNVFVKTANVAQMHTIETNSDSDGSFTLDGNNNLVLDLSKASIGSALENAPSLRIEDAQVSDKLMKADPKMTAKKLTNLMNQYTIFNIKSMIVSKFTFKTDLTIFPKLFIVFPDITVDGRFNTPYNTGSLQVSGHFENNDSNSYKFVPDSNIGIVYKNSTVNVKAFKVYISDIPNSKSHILANQIEYSIGLRNIYNCPLVIQNIDKQFYPDVFIVNCAEINGMELEDKKYSILYNKTFKTVKLLPTIFSYDSVPRYHNIKSMKIKKPITNPKIKPLHPYSAMVLRDLYHYQTVGYIWVQNPLSYPTDDEIKRLYNEAKHNHKINVEINFKTYSLSQYSDVNALIHSVNYFKVDTNNLISTPPTEEEIINAYESRIPAMYGIPLRLVKKSSSGYDISDWIKAYNEADNNIINWSETLANRLMDIYNRGMREYNTREDEHVEIIGEVNPSADMDEYQLEQIGLFANDYDYIINYSKDPIISKSLKYWDVTNQKVIETLAGITSSSLKSETLHISDFYALDGIKAMARYGNKGWNCIDLNDSSRTVNIEEEPNNPIYIKSNHRYIYIDIYNTYSTTSSITLPTSEFTSILMNGLYYYYSNIEGGIVKSNTKPKYSETYGEVLNLGYKQMEYFEPTLKYQKLVYVPDYNKTVIEEEIVDPEHGDITKIVYHYVNPEGVLTSSDILPSFIETFQKIDRALYNVIYKSESSNEYMITTTTNLLKQAIGISGFREVVHDSIDTTFNNLNGLYVWMNDDGVIECSNVEAPETDYYKALTSNEDYIYCYLNKEGVILTDNIEGLTVNNTIVPVVNDITRYPFYDIEPRILTSNSSLLSGLIYLDEYGNENKIVYTNTNKTIIKYKYPNIIKSSNKIESITSSFTVDNLFGVIEPNGNFILSIRDVPYKENMYKTFKIDFDLLGDKEWELNDYLYSIFQLDATYAPIENLFKKYTDMKMKTLTPSDRITDTVDYDTMRIIKYFVNHLDNLGNNLIVKTNEAINTPTVTINNVKYISNTLNKKMSQINFNETLSEPITIKNAAVNMQLTIELQ